MENPYTVPVADLAAREQSSFLTRVYAHLVLAVLLFVGLEVWFFKSGIANTVLQIFSGVSWLVVLGGFMLLSWVATLIAVPSVARPLQYVGFVLYVLLQALITVPLLAAANDAAPGVIASAAQVTIGGFLLLTAVVVTTGKDFSFLRSFLIWGGLVRIGGHHLCRALRVQSGHLVFRRHDRAGCRIGALHDVEYHARLSRQRRGGRIDPTIRRHCHDVLVCAASLHGLAALRGGPDHCLEVDRAVPAR